MHQFYDLQSHSTNPHHPNGQYYTMSGGVTSYMPSPVQSVVAKVPECSDLEPRMSMSGDFGIDNSGGMVLNSNTNTHLDYYERSLYDEFTLKHQQQHLNHPNGSSNVSSHSRFSASSNVPSNGYSNNGSTEYRNYPHPNTITSPPNANTFHQLQTPSFNGSVQHPTTQAASIRHNYLLKNAQQQLNGSGGNRSDISDEVGSLAALDGLTDLLPMMPTSEAVKLSLRDIEGIRDDDSNDEQPEGKPLINNNSLVLIGSSPTSPTTSTNGSNASITLKNWDESGSVASSHSSAFSSSETPPPLHPSTSLYHLQPLKPLYNQPEPATKFTG